MNALTRLSHTCCHLVTGVNLATFVNLVTSATFATGVSLATCCHHVKTVLLVTLLLCRACLTDACVAQNEERKLKRIPYNSSFELVSILEEKEEHEGIPIWFWIMISFVLLSAAVIAVWQMIHPYMHRKRLEREAAARKTREGWRDMMGMMVNPSMHVHTMCETIFEQAEKQRVGEHVAGWRRTFE